uniref:SCAN box domain-containing protein n=1 Tax=Takifugu rubripes TaxID=31033 RepID=A0A674N499_TAKRU
MTLWDGSDFTFELLLLQREQMILEHEQQMRKQKLELQARESERLLEYERLKCHERSREQHSLFQMRQTHVDVARELISLCNRWCTAVGVKTFQELFDLVVLEQFKNITTKRITTYINEHQIKTAAQVAGLADEFILTRKSFRDTSQHD